MTDQLPLVIRVLNERLHYRYWGPQRVVRLDTFTIDVSEWKIAFSHHTPCFWVHTPELLNLAPLDLAEEIRDAVRQQNWQNETVLVLVDRAAQELRDHLCGSFTQFVVLDEAQQKQIAAAPSPTRVLLDMVLGQIPRSQLAPYQTHRPVTGSRFFGRDFYIKKIINHPQNNYLVVGIRRIGKSSLLREIERKLDLSDPPGEGKKRRLYIDCSVITSADDLYREIVGRLSPNEVKLFLGRGNQSQRFRARMFEILAERNGGPITYLLDEIDGLLKNLGGDLSLFEILRGASQKDNVGRFIVAGFREAMHAIRNENTPLYNFGDRLTLTALERSDVKDMVEKPMDQLRVKLEPRDAIVQRIYRETAGMPNLVQFYCQTLLEQLDQHDRGVITIEDLKYVYENANLRDFVIGPFIHDARPLENAIAFSMLDRDSFGLEHIDHELRRHGLKLRLNVLSEACNHLETAGILVAHGKQYSFATPLFSRTLQENFSVEHAMESAREELLAAQAPARRIP